MQRSKFGFSWNILDVPGQFAGNKKPAEPIAMRVSVYFSELLQTTSNVACETVCAERFEKGLPSLKGQHFHIIRSSRYNEKYNDPIYALVFAEIQQACPRFVPAQAAFLD